MANKIRVVIQKPVDGAGFILENGNATTANGNAVDLGGVTNASVTVNDNNDYGVTISNIKDNGFDPKKTSQLIFKDGQVSIRSISEDQFTTDEEFSLIGLSPSNAILQYLNVLTSKADKVTFSASGGVLSLASGNGFSFTDYTADNANVGAWGTATNAIRSEAEIIDNTVQHSVTGEPTGSDPVLNMVSLTQAEYDAGTPVATTFYLITDA